MFVLSSLKHVFPPPRYITLPSVGVDISDTSLKYISFERAHPRDQDLKLQSWGDISLPTGVVERGNVHDVAKLTATLAELKERTDAEYVAVSLPEERAYLFETKISGDASRKDMRSLIEFKLEENVPLSPRDAYFDFSIIDRDEDSGDYRVAVAVYAQETINAYYEACIGARLVPRAFEIEAAAIARASVPQGRMGTYLIVDFGKTRMGVGIVHRGTLMYTSTIELSGQDMSLRMREVLGDLPESELTMIKNTRGLTQVPGNEKIVAALEPAVSSMAEELGIRIHYWHTRDVDRAAREVEKVILCGGSSNLLGLPEYLTEKLGVPVERAQVWQNAFSFERLVPPITRPYSYGYATAIGLALRNFITDV